MMRPIDHFHTLTVNDYKNDLIRYLAKNGPMAHNLISLTLRLVDKQFGQEAANQLIDEFDLTKKFGLRKRIEKR